MASHLKIRVNGLVHRVAGCLDTPLFYVTFNASNVTSPDWVTDPATRRAPAGAGEEPISALFPAIANGFFDATGVRLRQAPMTPAVVRNALARAGVK
jgi:hypothetical protein